jgi:hypothetical protein
MLSSTIYRLTLLVLAMSASSTAQTQSYFLMFRVAGSNLHSGKHSNTCVIVGDDGQFRLEILSQMGTPNKKNTKVFTGIMSAELHSNVKALAESESLVALGNVPPNQQMKIVKDEVHLVALRVRRHTDTQEIAYVVSDGKPEVPAPVKAFEPWLKALLESKGDVLKDAEPNSCRFLDAPPNFKPELQRR